jgi:hypothetical protein
MTSLDALRIRSDLATWDRMEAERRFGLGWIELGQLMAAYDAESEARADYWALLNGGRS